MKSWRKWLSILSPLSILAIGFVSVVLLDKTFSTHELQTTSQSSLVFDIQRLQHAFESKSASSRGYLLTGQEMPYLQTMERARARFLDLIQDLSEKPGLVRDEAFQRIALMERAHEEKLDALIGLRKRNFSSRRIGEMFVADLQPLREKVRDELQVLLGRESEKLERTRGVFKERIRAAEAMMAALALLGALVTWGVLFTLNRLSEEKRLRQELESTVQELHASKRQLRDLTRRLHQTLEQERLRIGREIHDELGQSLTVLKMQIHHMKRQVKDPQMQNGFSDMSSSIYSLVSGVREIAAELRPSILSDGGLGDAVDWLVGNFRQKTLCEIRLTIDLQEELSQRYSEEIESAIYRILQEALTNAVRHSDSMVFDVIVRESDDGLEAMLRDYGRQVPASYESRRNSIGVVGMRERAESLGGDFSISYVSGQGTVVRTLFTKGTSGEIRA